MNAITAVRPAFFQICILQHTSLNFPVLNVFCIITNISGELVHSKSPFMSWTSEKTPCLSNWVISCFRISTNCCISCSATKCIEIMKLEGICMLPSIRFHSLRLLDARILGGSMIWKEDLVEMQIVWGEYDHNPVTASRADCSSNNSSVPCY